MTKRIRIKASSKQKANDIEEQWLIRLYDEAKAKKQKFSPAHEVFKRLDAKRTNDNRN